VKLLVRALTHDNQTEDTHMKNDDLMPELAELPELDLGEVTGGRRIPGGKIGQLPGPLGTPVPARDWTGIFPGVPPVK
jgi:hypothetical protein